MVVLRPIQNLPDASAVEGGAPSGSLRAPLGELMDFPFAVSGKTSRSLIRRARQLAEWARSLPGNIDPCHVSYTLCERRPHYRHRTIVFASSLAEFAAALDVFGQAPVTPGAEADASLVAGLLASLRSTDPGERREAQDAIRAGFEAGARVDFSSFYRADERRTVSLPPYPFEKNPLWSPEGVVSSVGSEVLEPVEGTGVAGLVSTSSTSGSAVLEPVERAYGGAGLVSTGSTGVSSVGSVVLEPVERAYAGAGLVSTGSTGVSTGSTSASSVGSAALEPVERSYAGAGLASTGSTSVSTGSTGVSTSSTGGSAGARGAGLRGVPQGDGSLVRCIRLEDFWMRDHRVGSEHIFPGVGYVELALSSSGVADDPSRPAVEIADVGYRQPLVLSEERPARDLRLEFPGGRAGGSFEIVSAAGDSRVVHCSGRIRPAGQVSRFAAHPDHIDPTDLFGGFARTTSGHACYQEIARTGLMLGPSFNAIATIASDEDRAAARIVLPEALAARYAEFDLHPSVFDGALEIVYRLADASALSMPAGIERIGFFEKPEQECIAYATRSAEQRPGELRYDVSIFQPDGGRAVAVEGFTFKDLTASGPAATAPPAAQYFTLTAVPEPCHQGDVAADIPAGLLLVNGSEDLTESLAAAVPVAALDHPALATTPRPGDRHSTIPVLSVDDDLSAVDAVVVDLGVPAGQVMPARHAELLHAGLLAVEQDLVRLAPRARQVVVVDAGAHEPIARALHAFALTIGLEAPRTTVTVVATDARGPERSAQVLDELGRGEDAVRGLVSYEGGVRRVLRTTRLDGAQNGSLARAAGTGVFVVTGGTGAIGRMVSEELARESNTVVLLGSRRPDESTTRQLEAIRRRGAHAEYHAVDLRDESEVRDILDGVERTCGAIAGVFHLAGTTADARLADKDPDRSAAVLAPKVSGTTAIARALRGRGARFLLLASSLAAVTGNVGQEDYAFANGFMDGLAVSASGEDDFRTVTVNWSVWKDGGIHIDGNVLSMFRDAFGIVPLTREQGIGSIAAALTHRVPQVVVVAGDARRIEEHLGVVDAARVPADTDQAVADAVDDVVLREHASARLRRIVIDSIKLAEEDFDPDRSVQDYGYTSLTMVDLANTINRSFGVSVTPALFFSAGTVNQLADHLVKRDRDALMRSYRPETAGTGTPRTRAAGDPASAPRPTGTVAGETPTAPTTRDDAAFAIVGMDVTMPGSADVHAYWEHLVARDCMVTTVPEDRWDWRRLDDDLRAAGQAPISHFGGFMDSVHDFDRALFGISPREAVLMDPQQRLAMESVRKTVESAGYRVADLAGSRTGIFMGVATMDYSDLLQEAGTPIDAYTSTGASHSVLVNRISFAFDWSGPSEPVDTACSSSLVAIHRACEAIRSGSCDAAIAGGVNVIVSPLLHTAFSRAGMLSPTGLCHSFDAQADGYVRGEGVGSILIKPLADAVRDGDAILATIRGTAVNHGGRASSLTAPNPHAQARVISDAWRETGVEASGIGYIEAHGTGTKLGDPVEIDGLREAFSLLSGTGELPAGAECSVGTVKANIGHLEAAAGIAGVAKLVMMLREGVIPGHPTLGEVNPYVDLEGSGFVIQRETRSWERARSGDGEELPRDAGISSFGFGGANAHIAIEEYPRTPRRVSPPRATGEILVFSARTPESLARHIERHTRFFSALADGAPSLADVAFTLREGREAYRYRALFVVDGATPAAASGQLRDAMAGRRPGQVFGSEDFDVARDRPALLEALGFDARITEVASGYLRGEDVDWGLLRPVDARRVLLPNVPLKRTRCWPVEVAPAFRTALGLPAVERGDGRRPAASDADPSRERVTGSLHPMIDSAERGGSGTRFLKALDPSDFFLADHVVNGKTILPGAAYVELARAVAHELGLPEQLTISRLVWENVLELDGGEQTMIVNRAGPSVGDGLDLVVSSESSCGVVEHCTCTVTPGLSSSPRVFDLGELMASGERSLSREYCYDTLYRRVGFDYGPSFQVTQTVRSGASSAVAELRLPDIPGVDDPRFVLHPSLIDGAIRSIAGIANQRHSSTYIPFSVERIEVFAPCPSHCYSISRIASEPGGSIRTMLFDVSVTDESGNECVRFTNLMVRGFSKGRDEDDQEFVLASRWVDADAVRPAGPAPSSGSVMVVSRSPEHVEGLARVIASDLGRDVVPVVHQERPGRGGPDTFAVGGDLDAGLASVLRTIEAQGRMPSDVVVDLSGYAEAERDVCAGSGITLLVALARALSPATGRRCHLTVFHPRGTSPRALLPAATAGFARSMTVVAPRLHWTLVEVEQGVSLARAASETLALAPHASGTRQRVAADARQVEVFERLADHELIGGRSSLHEGAVCVITGGMGRIGLALARRLSRKYHMRLALVGRRGLDGQIEAELSALDSLGGQAAYFPCDVTRAESVDEVLAAVRDRWGRVDGVVHAAGVMSDAMIFEADDEDKERVLATKIAGAVNLDISTAGDDLDFFVMFSSVSSLIGDRGTCTYGAANAYLDALAEAREELRTRGERAGRSLSIDWPMWADGGMPVPGTPEGFFEETGMLLLETEAGLDLFEWMMTLDHERLMYVRGRSSTIRRVFQLDERNPRPRGDLAARHTGEAGPRGATGDDASGALRQLCVGHLTSLLAGVSGYTVTEIDEDQEFEDFGIDSLMILDLNERLAADFPDLERTIFFEYNRISQLADYLVAERTADVRALAARIAPPTQAVAGDGGVVVVGAPREAAVCPVAAPDHTDEPIAIIGMNGRFPDAGSVDAFWRNLREGLDSIIEVPGDRWDHQKFFTEEYRDRTAIYAKWGAFLDDVAGFDPLLFRITHADARHIDPQERLFLENVYGTMEDAGYCAFPEDPVAVGVFVGVMYGHYQLLALERTLRGAETVTSSAYASIANRASYVFNFSGPSIAVDTMCSSSLTSIHLACEALRRDECTMAIAGGVNVTVHPDKYRFLSAQHFAATDGRCRAFGEGGDGYVPGEAVASVLLKPLRDAERDNDHIYAVIRGSAINHGGKTNGYTVTNPNAQAAVIGRALEKSGVSARDVTYVEAHGTGTQLGDPIEIRGLVKAFSADTDETGFCRIGSVKSNIGHAEGAAGIVSLIKTVEQLRNHEIAPSLHSEVLNPQIDFARTPFVVAQGLQEWKPAGTEHDGVHGTLIAGVSSFGAGGSNAHLVVEEYPGLPEGGREASASGQEALIPLSARNQAGMERLLAAWESYLTGADDGAAAVPSVADDVIAAVADLLRVPDAGQIDASLSLDEIGIDSFLCDGLTSRILECSGVRVTWGEIAHLESLADVAHYVDARREPTAAASHLAGGLPACRDIAFTMQRGRIPHQGARAALVVRTHEELLAGIRMLRQGETSARVFSSAQPGSEVRLTKQEVAELVSRRDLRGVARAFVQGARVAWEGLVPDGAAPRRVSLPLYPCERQPLWLDPLPPVEAASVAVDRKLAPLVDENVSTLDTTRFLTRLDPSFGAIHDHVIQGSPLMPGAQYLEILAEVAGLACGGEVTTVRNVVWRTPTVVSRPRSIYADLARGSGGITVSLCADVPDGTNYAFQAQIAACGAREPSSGRVDIGSLASGTGSRFGKDAVYERFAEAGMDYGPRMQPIEETFVGETEVLARLRLPRDWDRGSSYDLHPSLLDGAFQAVAVSAMDPGHAGTARRATVPLGLDSLTIHAPIPDECYVHVTPRSGDTFAEAQARKLTKYSVRILDTRGNVVVDIDGFSGMAVPGPKGAETASRPTRPVAESRERDDAHDRSILGLLTALEKGAVSPELVTKALSEHDA